MTPLKNFADRAFRNPAPVLFLVQVICHIAILNQPQKMSAGALFPAICGPELQTQNLSYLPAFATVFCSTSCSWSAASTLSKRPLSSGYCATGNMTPFTTSALLLTN